MFSMIHNNLPWTCENNAWDISCTICRIVTFVPFLKKKCMENCCWMVKYIQPCTWIYSWVYLGSSANCYIMDFGILTPPPPLNALPPIANIVHWHCIVQWMQGLIWHIECYIDLCWECRPQKEEVNYKTQSKISLRYWIFNHKWAACKIVTWNNN